MSTEEIADTYHIMKLIAFWHNKRLDKVDRYLPVVVGLWNSFGLMRFKAAPVPLRTGAHSEPLLNLGERLS